MIPKQKPGPPRTTRLARVPTRLERLRRILAEFRDVVEFVTAVNPTPLRVRWCIFPEQRPEGSRLTAEEWKDHGILAEVHPDDLRPLQSSCAKALLSLKVTRGDGTRECYAGGYRYQSDSGQLGEYMAEADLRYAAKEIMDERPPGMPENPLMQQYDRVVKTFWPTAYGASAGKRDYPGADRQQRWEARAKLAERLERTADLCHRIAEEGLSDRVKNCDGCGGVLFDTTQRNDTRRHLECAPRKAESQRKKVPPG